MTFRRLETIGVEIAFYINERPLGTIAEDDIDRMITPNMLTKGRSLTAFTTPSAQTMTRASVERIWQQRKKTLTQYWDQWLTDYLSTLSIDKKWLKGDVPAVKAGDTVILKSDTQEKGQWRLARVTKVNHNQDGEISSVSVQFPNGAVYNRSIRQVALLEPAAEELDRNPKESSVSASSDRPEVVRGGLAGAVAPMETAGSPERPESCLLAPSGREEEASTDVEYADKPNTVTGESGSLMESESTTRDAEELVSGRNKRRRAPPGYYALMKKGKVDLHQRH